MNVYTPLDYELHVLVVACDDTTSGAGKLPDFEHLRKERPDRVVWTQIDRAM